MRKFGIGVVLLAWMMLTVFLCLSVIGLFLILPQGDGGYVTDQRKLRSTWMRIGYDLKDALIAV